MADPFRLSIRTIPADVWYTLSREEQKVLLRTTFPAEWKTLDSRKSKHHQFKPNPDIIINNRLYQEQVGVVRQQGFRTIEEKQKSRAKAREVTRGQMPRQFKRKGGWFVFDIVTESDATPASEFLSTFFSSATRIWIVVRGEARITSPKNRVQQGMLADVYSTGNVSYVAPVTVLEWQSVVNNTELSVVKRMNLQEVILQKFISFDIVSVRWKQL